MIEQVIDNPQISTNPIRQLTMDEEDINDDNGPTGSYLLNTTDVHLQMACSIAHCCLRDVLDTHRSEDATIGRC